MKDEQVVKIAKALADPTRLRILREIKAAGEMTCSRACELATVSQPTISHHVRTLEEAGLITIRRQGQFHILRVDELALRTFSRVVAGTSTERKPASKPSRPSRRKTPAKARTK